MSLNQRLNPLWLCVFLALQGQTAEPKDLPENRGSIERNTYHNPSLRMKIELPGSWHFFDRTMYTSAEGLRKEKEEMERMRAKCQGPLCGQSQVDVALQTDKPFVHAIFLTAFELSPEYQNRQRHPLRRFAEAMILPSLRDQWVAEGELTAMQLGGRPAYRLVIHSARNPSAKGFVYVADANGRVFMLLGTAMSEGDKLESAIERLTFSDEQG